MGALMNEHEEAGYKQFLENKVADLEAEVADLKQQIENLKRQKGISSASEGLTANDRTGTWVDASTGKHHCTRCLLKDEKRVPLKTEPHGWRCMVCTKYYADPDRPDEPIDYGNSSWMT